MTDEQYRDGLIQAYQGEVLGEAFFLEIAEHIDSGEHREKLRLLAKLEAETRDRIGKVLLRRGWPVGDSDSTRKRARETGAAAAKASWGQFMTRLIAGLPRFEAEYVKLQAGGPREDAEMLGHLVAHELALYTFAERELSGDTRNSLAPVAALLSGEWRGDAAEPLKR